MSLAERKEKAKSYVREVRSRTICQRCGKQPIDWHRTEHEQKYNNRVSAMAMRGEPVAKIQAEIDLCTPLCRSCHMKEDGRLTKLLANRPRQKGMKFPPKPCVHCHQLAKPLRRGLCNRCNHRKRLGKLNK